MWRAMAGAVAVSLVLPVTASAQIEALAAREGGQAPVLDGGSVFWSVAEGPRGVRVWARPAGGGAAVDAARVSVPSGSVAGWSLAAGSGRVGVRIYRGEGEDTSLFGGPFGGALAALRPAPVGTVMASERDLWTSPAGFVTLERVTGIIRAIVTDDAGASRVVATPSDVEVSEFAVAGANAAIALPGLRQIAVFDLASGTIVRRIPFGQELSGFEPIALSLGADGTVAVTGASGSVGQLAWAPPSAAALELVASSERFGLVAVAGDKIAVASPGGRRDALRPVVLQPRGGGREPLLLWRGPPAFQIEALDFDGTHVAWASQPCQFVATVRPSGSRLTVPPGPCARSDAAVTIFSSPHISRRNPSLPVRIRCLTAPTSRCRVDVRAYAIGDRSARLGRTRTFVPRGAQRTVRVPIKRRAAARLRRGGEQGGSFYVIRLIDPDGRTHVIGPI